MNLNNTPRRSLAMSTVAYFGSVIIIGFPVMYLAYSVFGGILVFFQLNWFVTYPTAIIVVAAAFLVGIWAAGQVAERIINRRSKQSQ